MSVRVRRRYPTSRSVVVNSTMFVWNLLSQYVSQTLHCLVLYMLSQRLRNSIREPPSGERGNHNLSHQAFQQGISFRHISLKLCLVCPRQDHNNGLCKCKYTSAGSSLRLERLGSSVLEVLDSSSCFGPFDHDRYLPSLPRARFVSCSTQFHMSKLLCCLSKPSTQVRSVG